MARRTKKMDSRGGAELILGAIHKALPFLTGRVYTAAMTAQTMLRVGIGLARSRYKSDRKLVQENEQLRRELSIAKSKGKRSRKGKKA